MTTIFMLLFGINFSCYYLILTKYILSVWKDEELRAYLGVFVVSTALITLNIYHLYSSVTTGLRHAAFQVSTVMTTTGFATADFDKWPIFSKQLMLCLMFVGASAGSTAGGLKFLRLLLLRKNLRRHIHRTLYPNRVQVVRMNGQKVSEKILDGTDLYLIAYSLILIFDMLAGRLEILPLLGMLSISTWKRR